MPVYATKSCALLPCILRQMHTHTWSTFEYLKGCLYTKTGCLAGTHLADMLYCFLMIWYLSAVHLEAQRQGLVHQVPYESENYFNIAEEGINKECHSISFVDDMAFSLIQLDQQN